MGVGENEVYDLIFNESKIICSSFIINLTGIGLDSSFYFQSVSNLHVFIHNSIASSPRCQQIFLNSP